MRLSDPYDASGYGRIHMIHAAFEFSRIRMKNADPYDANGSGYGRIRMMLPDLVGLV